MYIVCMARVNVYLPTELAEEAREAGLNVSAVAQDAIREELRIRKAEAWWGEHRAWRASLSGSGASNEDVIRALDEAREEFGQWPRPS